MYMCMFVHVHGCVLVCDGKVCVHACLHVCVSEGVHVHACVLEGMCVHACVHVCARVCERVQVRAYVRVHACACEIQSLRILTDTCFCFPQSERCVVGVGICVSLAAVHLEGDLGVIWEMSRTGCWVEGGLLMDLVR